MTLVNLTPHSINFVNEDGSPLVTVEPSGQLARVTAKTVTTGSVSVGDVTLPVTGTTYGEVEGLPAPEEGTIYIVSSLVAQRVPHRDDVFIPNESVRDEAGRIVGCKSLGRVPKPPIDPEQAAVSLGFASFRDAYVAMMHS